MAFEKVTITKNSGLESDVLEDGKTLEFDFEKNHEENKEKSPALLSEDEITTEKVVKWIQDKAWKMLEDNVLEMKGYDTIVYCRQVLDVAKDTTVKYFDEIDKPLNDEQKVEINEIFNSLLLFLNNQFSGSKLAVRKERAKRIKALKDKLPKQVKKDLSRKELNSEKYLNDLLESNSVSGKFANGYEEQ